MAQQLAQEGTERLGARDADVDVAGVIAVSPGPRTEEKNFEPWIRHHVETDFSSLGEVAFLEGRAGLRMGDCMSHGECPRITA